MWKCFDSGVIGIYPGENHVVAVPVYPRLFGGYRIAAVRVEPFSDETGWRAAVDRILDSAPAHLPVAPVSPGGLQFCSGVQEDDAPHILQPPRTIAAGHLPIQSAGRTMSVYLPRVRELLEHLNRRRRRAPVPIPPGVALAASVLAHREFRERNVLAVSVGENLSHIAAVSGGKLVSCRSVRRRPDHLLPEIRMMCRKITRGMPAAAPEIILTDRKIPDNTRKPMPDLPPIADFPGVPHDAPAGRVLAEGAARACLAWGHRVFPIDPRRIGGFRLLFSGFANRLLALAAILLVAVNINVFLRTPEPPAGDMPAAATDVRENLRRMAAVTGSDKAQLAPGRSAGELVRRIAAATDPGQPVIDALTGDLHHISIRGRAESLAAVSKFRESLVDAFPGTRIVIAATDHNPGGGYGYHIVMDPVEGDGP